jgi:hypothetical protein
MTRIESIRQELYADLKHWEKRMTEKIQHDVVAMREFIDVRIDAIIDREDKK